MRKLPWLTAAVLAGTAAVNLWAAADRSVLRALERDPESLSVRHWWRLASPLLVQSDGAAQLVFNLVTLALFGVLAERVLGRTRWLALYLGAGLLGQALGYAWEPPGGGNSVAVCGLVGGIAAALLRGRGGWPEQAGQFVAIYAVALAGLALGGWPAQLAAIGAVVVTSAVVGRRSGTAFAGRVLAGVVALAGGALLAVRDHHGAALLCGMLLGALSLPGIGDPQAPGAPGSAPAPSPRAEWDRSVSSRRVRPNWVSMASAVRGE